VLGRRGMGVEGAAAARLNSSSAGARGHESTASGVGRNGSGADGSASKGRDQATQRVAWRHAGGVITVQQPVRGAAAAAG
jgi:hypothetical protein